MYGLKMTCVIGFPTTYMVVTYDRKSSKCFLDKEITKGDSRVFIKVPRVTYLIQNFAIITG